MKKSNTFFVFAFAILLTGCAGGTNKPPAVNKIKITSEQLLGQDTAWVDQQIGQPAFKRRDGQAEMWQYKKTKCVLSVFIYEDAPGSKRRVLHFDARDLEGNSVDRDLCLNGM